MKNSPTCYPNYIGKVCPVFVVVAISEEHGLEVLRIFSSSINSCKFVSMLNKIKNYGDDFVIFGDNVSYHNSVESRRASELSQINSSILETNSQQFRH